MVPGSPGVRPSLPPGTAPLRPAGRESLVSRGSGQTVRWAAGSGGPARVFPDTPLPLEALRAAGGRARAIARALRSLRSLLPLALFGGQLGLNGLWSGLLCGLQRRGMAFVDVVLLWFAILATAVAFWDRRPLAGALLIPYLAWVGFAAALNLVIWRLNL